VSTINCLSLEWLSSAYCYMPLSMLLLGTHAVPSFSSVVGPSVTGIHDLSLLDASAGRHAVAVVSAVVGHAVIGPTVAGVLAS
jgi:hypothetical protein